MNMTATYGRSPIEIAEDQVIAMCGRVYNVSRQDAARYQQQRVEIAQAIREKAEQLLDEWDGTDQQVEAAYRLHLPWSHATRLYRFNA